MKTPKTIKRLTALALSLILLAASPALAAVSDVKPTNWAYPAIQYSVENKLIAIDYSTYDMEAPAPRQDVAYALYKLTNGRDNEPADSEHEQYVPQDMKNSADKYKYSVQWAVENRIIAGIRNEGVFGSRDYKTWFAPNDIITREQMAGLLYRLSGHDELDPFYDPYALYAFDDGGTVSSWARTSMTWCVSKKLMAGTGNNKLSPKGTLTYGQLAQLVMMYGQLKAASPKPSPSPEPSPSPDTGYHPSYYNLEPLPISAEGASYGNYNRPAKQDFSWLHDPETDKDTDYLKRLDISGPWDDCEAVPKTWLPEGGYIKDGHRYNKYHVCIDKVDGLPTKTEKQAFICINQHRVNNGRKPLEWDQAAQVIAEIRSLEQYQQSNKISHTRPDGDSHIDHIIDECRTIGILDTKTSDGWLNENLHSGELYNAMRGEVFGLLGFVASAGHNETLLDPNTTHGAISDLGGTTSYNGLQMH